MMNSQHGNLDNSKKNSIASDDDDNAAVITADDIREKVRTCMLKVKKDEVFMSHNLTTSDLNILKTGSDKEKMYQFFDLVCSQLDIKEEKKKFISERLQGISFVTEEITNFDYNKATSEEVTNVVNSDKENQPSQDDDPIPRNSTDGTEKITGNSNKKRCRSSKSPKNPSKGKRRRAGNSISFSNEEKKQYAAEVKMEFETEKEEVLSSLDAKYKELFGKIAFCKYKTDPYRPVLICSPYSVPPELRETWMKMRKNTKGKAKRMWYYTYWYGSPLEEAYTQSKRKDFVMYEEGEKRELHHLDKNIQKKIDKGEKLSRPEEQTVRGFKELELELTKSPSQRRPEDFVEYHDAILDLSDTVSIPDSDSITESDSTESEDYYDKEGGQKNKKSVMREGNNKKGAYKPTEKNEKNERIEDISLVKEKSLHSDDEQFKRRRDASLLGKRRGEERDAYKKCCEMFQSLTEEFQEAIEGKDHKKIMQCIKDIKSKDVSKLTAPFMEETKLSILVKRAKPMLVDNSDKKLRKDLYDELRNVYDKKKDNVPEGWKKISRSAIKATAPKVGKKFTEKNINPENESRKKDEENDESESEEESHARESKEERKNENGEKSEKEIPASRSDKRELSTPEQKLSDDKENIAQLQRELGIERNRIRQHEEKISKLEDENKLKEQDNAKHFKKIRQLQGELGIERNRIQQHEEKISKLEGENKLKEQDNAKHIKKISRQHQRELVIERNRIRQHEEKVSKLEDENKLKEQEISRHLEKIRQLQCEIDSEKDFNLKAADTIFCMETENKRIQELQVKAQNLNDEKTEKINQLRNEIDLLEKDRKTEIQNNASRVAENSIQHESQKRQITELQKQLEAAKSQVSELVNDNEKCKQLLTNLKELLRTQSPF